MKRNRLAAPIAATTVVFCCAIALVMAGDPPSAPAIPAKVVSPKGAYEVVRLEDPVTLLVKRNGKQSKVALAGIVTPPAQHLEACASAASNLLAGEAIQIDYVGEASGDEPHAYVFRAPDGLFVNVELIRAGFALPSEEKHDHLDVFRAYHERAKALRKGIWREAAATPTANPGAKSGDAPAPDDTIVFITRTGQRYHREDCEHLKKSKKPVPLKDAKKKGLTPCESCNPPQ